MKNILILGGSGGIGREISLTLSGRDKRVFIHGKTKEKVDRIVKKNNNRNFPSEGLVHDIKEIQPFIEKVKSVLPIHVLVLSYGPLLEKEIDTMSFQDWENMYLYNAVMPGMLISLCLPGMIKEGYGKIILFGGTGTGTVYGYSKIPAYASAKAGLPIIAKSIAKKYGSKGITCNVISPGFAATEYYTNTQIEHLKNKIGSERLIDPKEIAEVVKFLISDSGDVINGATVPVNKGIDHI